MKQMKAYEFSGMEIIEILLDHLKSNHEVKIDIPPSRIRADGQIVLPEGRQTTVNLTLAQTGKVTLYISEKV